MLLWIVENPEQANAFFRHRLDMRLGTSGETHYEHG